MRIIFNLIYFIVFLVLALAAMFLGGVSGVAGTFYVMVEPGDLEANLIKVGSILTLTWLIVLFLRHHNKKIIKRNKQKKMQDELEKEA